MSRAETLLWWRIRPRALPLLRFRRQVPVGPYIADFACPSSKLVVEIDGETHGTDAEILRDARRTCYLESRGWRVLRFTNADVFKTLDDVVDAICRFAHQTPPPRSGGGSVATAYGRAKRRGRG